VPDPIYLDHAATTPLRRAAKVGVLEELSRVGNASSLHGAGRSARAVVEESREALAGALGAHPSEVLFCSGGTEADNLAVEGAFRARRAADPRRTRLVVSAIEHHAVLETAEYLAEHEGAVVTWVAPGADGVISPYAVRSAIASDPASVALVSVMWANNETGVVQPIREIAAVAAEFGIPMHSDAVQAFGHVPVDFGASGLSLMTVTAHKLGGPVGVGALVARRDAAVQPLSHGGGQERDLRSGTLNTAGARGFAVAATEAVADLAPEVTRLVGLRDRLIRGALGLEPTISVTGLWEAGDGIRRLPGNAHLVVPDCDGEALLYLLDAAGIACSTGSACRAGVTRHSHVLTAMGLADGTGGALRLTLGHTSTDADVDAFLAALPAAVAGARRALAVTR
jgi:cysteine desulfurase